MKPIPLGPFFLTFWMILSTASSETCDCEKNTMKRVVGELAKETDFTSTVNLFYRSCAGTLIDKDLVLTAASCFDEFGTSLDFQVGYGERDVTDPKKMTIPSSIIIHEFYDNKTRANNIALLKLKEPLTLDSSVSISCLPKGIDRAKLESMNVSVAGWGSTEKYIPNQYSYGTSMKLYKAEGLTVFKYNRCKFYISPNKFNENTFCAYSPKGSPCHFDEGGSVVGNYNGVIYLVGMVFQNKNNCGMVVPSFYLNVASYLSWIESKAGKTICSPSAS